MRDLWGYGIGREARLVVMRDSEGSGNALFGGMRDW